MIPPAFLSRFALATVLFCVAAPGAIFAADVTPPVVSVPVADLTVPVGTGTSVVNLKKTFALSGVTGKLVRFTTSLGSMDLELDAVNYPLNVANFLGYVKSGAYNNTFIHRSVSNFIFQGGGYYVASDLNFPHITVTAAVKGEHKGSNVRGTIAMALTGGTDSADTGTSEWFFNFVDNTGLDTFNSNQGPFTAFGHVVEDGLTTMDAIANVPTYNATGVVTSDDAAVFGALPLLNYTSDQGTAITPDLVYIKSITNLPLTPKVQGGVAALKVVVKGNTNPALVTASLDGRKLTLTYAPGVTGSSTITLMAKNPVTKSKVKTAFAVTVEPGR